MKTAYRAAAFLISALAAAALLMVAVPQSATAQQARTLSAGVGEEERGPHKDYSLKVVFAQRLGPYVAGADVVVYDEAGGKVLETVAEGSWLFVDLPTGRYRVAATLDGATTAGTVDVSAGEQETLYLTW